MTRRVHVVSRAGRLALSPERVTALAQRVLRAEGIGAAELSITFVSTPAIARLNARHLHHHGSTDVIAFPFAPPRAGAPLVGDIYIAPAVARANAARHGVGVRQELARLVVHGTLHILGHDHPVDASRTASPMWQRQERLLMLTRPTWR